VATQPAVDVADRALVLRQLELPRARSRRRGRHDIWAKRLTFGAVVLGIALRFRAYQFRRSLWTDEAMLALNVVRRGYVGLTGPLDLLQGAPIGFLWVQRASVAVFGNNELALRLFPFLAGVASLFLFVLVARRLLTTWAVPIAVLLFATIQPLVYYSSEAKQYSVDVAAGLLVVHATLRLIERPVAPRPALHFGALCAVAVLFSHPATIVAAAAVVLVGVGLARRQEWRTVRALALGSSLWMGVFLLQYLRSLRHLAGNDALDSFWAPGYAPRPFRLGSALAWAQHGIARLVPDPIAVGSPVVLLTLVTAGAFALSRRRGRAAALLLLMSGGALAAAMLHLYPLRWRLALYLVPFVVLTAVAAFDFAPPRSPARRLLRSAALVLIAVVAWTPVHDSVVAFRHPQTVTEMRPLLQHIAQRARPGDAIYVHWTANAEFEYYAAVLGLYRDRAVTFPPAPHACDDGTAMADLAIRARVWVVMGAPPRYDPADSNAVTLAHFDHFGRRVEDLRAPGRAEIALYDELDPGRPAPTAPVPHPGLCIRLMKDSEPLRDLPGL
jgi:dolichyl-phosphate-mannose-protein mannosyltransferase